jgi:Uma2 family endonuclease
MCSRCTLFAKADFEPFVWHDHTGRVRFANAMTGPTWPVFRRTPKRARKRVVTEPGIQPKVRADLNTRVPDLVVTCATWDPEDRLLRDPLVVIEILSPSNKADTWANVWTYPTIPSVREILVLYTAEIRIDLPRREANGSWPDNPVPLRLGDVVTLESINFSAPIAAFYRSA